MRLPGHSPLAVADSVKDLITGKTVCDVGCGQGELMEEFAKYAKKVIGMEEVPEVAQIARNKGLTVIETNTFFDRLPEADVYYIWTKDTMGVYLKALYEGTKGTFIMGDSVRPSTLRFMREIADESRDVDGFRIYIKYD